MDVTFGKGTCLVSAAGNCVLYLAAGYRTVPSSGGLLETAQKTVSRGYVTYPVLTQ